MADNQPNDSEEKAVINKKNPRPTIDELPVTCSHVMRSMKYQLVVLHDISLFKKKSTKCISLSWWWVIKLIIGYIAYVTPIIVIGLIFSFAYIDVSLCRPLKAAFLLDNDAKLAGNVSWSTIYTQRKDLDGNQRKDAFYNNGGLLWDAAGFNSNPTPDPDTGIVPEKNLTRGYRFQEHWPLNSIDDLLNQYNYAGYHDICNYPRYSSVSSILNLDIPSSKGLPYVYPGYVERNSSGFEYIYISA